MNYKVIIPARGNSKRLPGKNMKILGSKPLIQYSIDFALNSFPSDSIWVNSDNLEIIKFATSKGVKTLIRPNYLASDHTSTVDVLKFHIEFYKENNIECDAIILLQPTNPFRDNDLIEKAIYIFENSGRNSLATFSESDRKIGTIKNNYYKPLNYIPGQRSQDLKKKYFENGLLYITKPECIIKGKIITDCVYPLICNKIESTVDIDYFEDLIFAEALLNYIK